MSCSMQPHAKLYASNAVPVVIIMGLIIAISIGTVSCTQSPSHAAASAVAETCQDRNACAYLGDSTTTRSPTLHVFVEGGVSVTEAADKRRAHLFRAVLSALFAETCAKVRDVRIGITVHRGNLSYPAMELPRNAAHTTESDKSLNFLSNATVPIGKYCDGRDAVTAIINRVHRLALGLERGDSNGVSNDGGHNGTASDNEIHAEGGMALNWTPTAVMTVNALLRGAVAATNTALASEEPSSPSQYSNYTSADDVIKQQQQQQQPCAIVVLTGAYDYPRPVRTPVQQERLRVRVRRRLEKLVGSDVSAEIATAVAKCQMSVVVDAKKDEAVTKQLLGDPIHADVYSDGTNFNSAMTHYSIRRAAQVSLKESVQAVLMSAGARIRLVDWDNTRFPLTSSTPGWVLDTVNHLRTYNSNYKPSDKAPDSRSGKGRLAEQDNNNTTVPATLSVLARLTIDAKPLPASGKAKMMDEPLFHNAPLPSMPDPVPLKTESDSAAKGGRWTSNHLVKRTIPVVVSRFESRLSFLLFTAF